MDHAVAVEAAPHAVVAPCMLAAVTFLLTGRGHITLPLRRPRERLRRFAGHQLHASAEGIDEELAMNAIARLFAEGFGEVEPESSV